MRKGDELRIADLESLIWIARLGSFTAAADRLHITQSAITRRIRELETDLGVSLFSRLGRRVELTAEGRTALDYAERIVTMSARMRRDAGSASRIRGTVRLGAGEVFSSWWLSAFVVRASRAYPGVELEIDIDLSVRHIARFEENKLDMLLLPGEPPSSGEHILIDRIPYLWMASPRLGLPDRPHTPDEIARWPLLNLARDSHNFLMLGTWFRTHGVKPRRLEICNSLHVLADLVVSGLGISLLPLPLFQSRIDSGELQVIEATPPLPYVPLWAVYHEATTLPLASLAESARECHQVATSQRVARPVG